MFNTLDTVISGIQVNLDPSKITKKGVWEGKEIGTRMLEWQGHREWEAGNREEGKQFVLWVSHKESTQKHMKEEMWWNLLRKI